MHHVDHINRARVHYERLEIENLATAFTNHIVWILFSTVSRSCPVRYCVISVIGYQNPIHCYRSPSHGASRRPICQLTV